MQAVLVAHPSTKNEAGHARTVWLVGPTVAAKCNILLLCDWDVSRFATRRCLDPRSDARSERSVCCQMQRPRLIAAPGHIAGIATAAAFVAVAQAAAA